jgi:hypothetical protein
MEVPPQLVPPAPPSALATVGITKVLRNIRAAATTSRARFTVIFSLFWKCDRDTFMAPPRLKRSPTAIGVFGIRNKIFGSHDAEVRCPGSSRNHAGRHFRAAGKIGLSGLFAPPRRQLPALGHVAAAWRGSVGTRAESCSRRGLVRGSSHADHRSSRGFTPVQFAWGRNRRRLHREHAGTTRRIAAIAPGCGFRPAS